MTEEERAQELAITLKRLIKAAEDLGHCYKPNDSVKLEGWIEPTEDGITIHVTSKSLVDEFPEFTDDVEFMAHTEYIDG